MFTNLKLATFWLSAALLVGISAALVTYAALDRHLDAVGACPPAEAPDGDGGVPVNGLELQLELYEPVTVMRADGKNAEPVELGLRFRRNEPPQPAAPLPPVNAGILVETPPDPNVPPAVPREVRARKPLRLDTWDLLGSHLVAQVTGPDARSVQVLKNRFEQPPSKPEPSGFHDVDDSLGMFVFRFPGQLGADDYCLLEPGEYRVRLTYTNAHEAAVPFAAGSWVGEVTSNAVVLKVLPADDKFMNRDRALALARSAAEKALDAAYSEWCARGAEVGRDTPPHKGPWIAAEPTAYSSGSGPWSFTWDAPGWSGFLFKVRAVVDRAGKVEVKMARAWFTRPAPNLSQFQ
jgi:hypothetical protein